MLVVADKLWKTFLSRPGSKAKKTLINIDIEEILVHTGNSTFAVLINQLIQN
jgi:hypothetical protein